MDDLDEPVGLGKRYGLKDYCVHDGEDRDVGTDPERKRENRSQGKQRVLA
jgi:hypothetical protein